MAGRSPGASGLREYWTLLRDGEDAVDTIDEARFADRAPATPGPLVRAGLLSNIGDFDADFFGISPREAVSMDPQHRILLETAWEAFEDAGIVPERIAGSRSGVFVGVSSSQYWEQQVAAGSADIYGISGGGARSTSSGRLSYAFDLRGPSMSVDTACSSSLVAVALAGQSLSRGECDLALVGGVQLILGPAESELFTSAGMLSPDGRCWFGDTRANGFVRGAGVGVVVLKRLSTAIADGDPIRALVRGWGVSSDGAASGSLMAPALAGQRQMLHDAYAMAGIDPLTVAYVEAHGTGTPAGDPIELAALAAELCDGRAAGNPLIVGSVKTNIGHTEPAAGVMGLIKAVLCLEHEVIPASLNGAHPTELMDWARRGRRQFIRSLRYQRARGALRSDPERRTGPRRRCGRGRKGADSDRLGTVRGGPVRPDADASRLPGH
jgi:acyl transferase domain-containing protein